MHLWRPQFPRFEVPKIGEKIKDLSQFYKSRRKESAGKDNYNKIPIRVHPKLSTGLGTGPFFCSSCIDKTGKE